MTTFGPSEDIFTQSAYRGMQRHAEEFRKIKMFHGYYRAKEKSGELIVQIQKHIIHMSISEAKVIFKYPSISSYQQ